MEQRKIPKACAQCGFGDHVELADYCQNCGASIYCENICENPQCTMNYDDEKPVPIPEDALYCPFCGEESLYLRVGILQPQNAQKLGGTL